jgi:hypothetical protein
VEGTGAYGAAPSRYLRKQDVVIVEVDRSDRKTRHKGKSVLCALRGRLFALRVHHDARAADIHLGCLTSLAVG